MLMLRNTYPLVKNSKLFIKHLIIMYVFALVRDHEHLIVSVMRLSLTLFVS